MNLNYHQSEAVFARRFALRQIPPSKVAEISKTTAEADRPGDSKINLHIGNPVQEPLLERYYTALVLGLDCADITDPQLFAEKIEKLQRTTLTAQLIRLLIETIEKANPYMPRGGFNAKNPGSLIRKLRAWLISGQTEPLDYALGEGGNLPEICITSGGPIEALKLLLQVIDENLVSHYCNIVSPGKTVPIQASRAYSGKIIPVSGDVGSLLSNLTRLIHQPENRIGFILLNEIYPKALRRELAALATQKNLMIIELNDANNAASLAGSPGMAQRLIRILTPAALDARLTHSALAFVLGNAKYIEALNLMHFLKKGTPSATEVKLLSFLLDEKGGLDLPKWKMLNQPSEDSAKQPEAEIPEVSFPEKGLQTLAELDKTVATLSGRVESLIDKTLQPLEKLSERLGNRFEKFSGQIFRQNGTDPFSGQSSVNIISSFFSALENPAFTTELETAFLHQFLKLHPEFSAEFSMVLSGSARTALSTIVESWGLREVVIPDLSWTLGDAFPQVTAVPLNSDLSVNADEIIQVVGKYLRAGINWEKTGCVVINNPHNATGKITPEAEIAKILNYCLIRDVRVIDDLSYSNVIVAEPKVRQKRYPVKNCRQIAGELIARGSLPANALDFLVTVRSISKTDCKAGARLCVVEVPGADYRQRLREMIARVEPNRMALLIAYLFYRNDVDQINRFWALRDKIQWERLQALTQGLQEIPPSDNFYGIHLVPPEGAMYPHLVVDQLPENVSLPELSSKLARKGIGLVPMTTFALTASSYHYATRMFRLTLGGPAGSQQLRRQVQRLVTELTREIQRIAYNYVFYKPEGRGILADTLNRLPVRTQVAERQQRFLSAWDQIETVIKQLPEKYWRLDSVKLSEMKSYFWKHFLPTRKAVFWEKLTDRALLRCSLRERYTEETVRRKILSNFKNELRSETHGQRREIFQKRLFDRTVHPTQSYAIEVEKLCFQMIEQLLANPDFQVANAGEIARALVTEFLAANVAIKSAQEAEEAHLDLEILTLAEDYADYIFGESLPLLLALWGDWDGSRRPSGQGHNLVAGVLIANVRRLTGLLGLLEQHGILTEPDPVWHELGDIEKKIKNFQDILRKITKLTTALEIRFRRNLQQAQTAGRLVKRLRKVGLARDPLKRMWKHNDRNERRMQEYRRQRSSEILRFFQINYQLNQLIKKLVPRLNQGELPAVVLDQLARYKNPLLRFYLTPRIHQKIITARDSFAIDTTVYNLVEINKMGSLYGYPGLVLSLQVSMTNRADAIIALDKKLRVEWERVVRKNPEIKPVYIRIVPLFEEIEILQNIETFLDEIWEYVEESKRLGQSPQKRFSEIIGEFFVAGSDLSQQVSQPHAQILFKQTKTRINNYLLQKGVSGIRIKFGSGEPAQRQGGFYDAFAAQKVFQFETRQAVAAHLKVDSFTAEELLHARSPLGGIFSTSDFRTFQSNVIEKLRQIPASDLVNTFFHIRRVQADYENQIQLTGQTYWGSRRRLQVEMEAQLEGLLKGELTETYLEFTEMVRRNFQHILYGAPEDMAGIHVVSYFISRALLSVRDRPTVRPTKETGEDRRRQIVEHLSGTLPLSEHGTLLRAIGHNKAQSMILGINQLTTGLFRAMREFIGDGPNAIAQVYKLQKDILPQLPVKDILNSLRLYHDPNFHFLKQLEAAFPPGNTALKVLNEERRVFRELLPLLQQELMRQNGLTRLFKHREELSPEILRTIRPDLAVLLQANIFNTDPAFFGDASRPELAGIAAQLQQRELILNLQEQIWELLGAPITEQVKSFFELAQAIKALRSEGKISWPKSDDVSRGQISRLGGQVNRMLRDVADDSMRQFLISTVQYLLHLPETLEDIPEAVIIALRDVRKILILEEQTISPQAQHHLLFLFTNIARIAGEAG